MPNPFPPSSDEDRKPYRINHDLIREAQERAQQGGEEAQASNAANADQVNAAVIDTVTPQAPQKTPEQEFSNSLGKGCLWLAGIAFSILVIGTILSPSETISTADIEEGSSTAREASEHVEAKTSSAATEHTAPTPSSASLPVVARPPFNLAKLRKNQAYEKVRRVLMEHGFEPARYEQQDCSPYGTGPGEECFNRPEIWHCSGTGQGFCVGYWLNGEAAISVVVTEGPDGVFDNASKMTRADVIAMIGQDDGRLIN